MFLRTQPLHSPFITSSSCFCCSQGSMYGLRGNFSSLQPPENLQQGVTVFPSKSQRASPVFLETQTYWLLWKRACVCVFSLSDCDRWIIMSLHVCSSLSAESAAETEKICTESLKLLVFQQHAPWAVTVKFLCFTWVLPFVFLHQTACRNLRHSWSYRLLLYSAWS